jgi:hypothetical protein
LKTLDREISEMMAVSVDANKLVTWSDVVLGGFGISWRRLSRHGDLKLNKTVVAWNTFGPRDRPDYFSSQPHRVQTVPMYHHQPRHYR